MLLIRVLLILAAIALSNCASTRQNIEAVVPLGHSNMVTSVAFSPEGHLAISGSYDGLVKLWEIYTGREIRTFKGHSSGVTAVCFSPNGRQILSGSSKGNTILWDLYTGRKVVRFAARQGAVVSVAFTPDSRKVLTVTDTGNFNLWEISTGRSIKFIGRKGGGVYTQSGPVAISPDGRLLLLNERSDGTLRLMQAETGRIHQIFKAGLKVGHYVAPTASFSPDGHYIIVLRGIGSRISSVTMEFYDVLMGREIELFKGPTMVSTVVFSPDSQYVLNGFRNVLKLWDISTGEIIRTFSGHSDHVTSIAFSPDGRFILSGSKDNTLKLWDASAGSEIRTFSGHPKQMQSMRFSPDKRFTLSGTKDGLLIQSEVSTGRTTRVIRGHSVDITATVFSPDGRYAASGSKDNAIKVWNTSNGRLIRSMIGHTDDVTALVYSPDGRLILSASKDETLKLWNASTGREIHTFEGHSHWVTSVAFSPDGLYALSGSRDDTLKLWKLSSGQNIRTFKWHSGDVNSIAFSPDGRYVLSGSWRKLALWNVSTGRKLRIFDGHSGNVTDVTFSPDGRYALSGGDDHAVKLWRVTTGNKIRTFKGHLEEIISVVFSPDGQFVFSGSLDNTTRVWHTKTGKEITKYISSNDGEWIIITPDGYYNTSPEGASLLHWVYPGDTQTFTFEQFESQFKRADIIKARLSGDLAAGKPAPAMTRPPYVEMADYLTIKETSAKNYSLALTASALNEVKTVRVFVNGKPTLEVPVNLKEKELLLDVKLFSGANRITAVAYDEKGFSSNPKYIDVISKHEALVKPNLYILAIGISDYPRLPTKWQLEFAHSDAKALFEAIKNQEGKLFKEVRYRFLDNKKATVETITEAMDVLSSVGENDLVVIFMAGHGVKSRDGTFYFLTSDGTLEDPSRGGLSWALIGEYLSKIKGRVILLLDACHSGSIVTETVVPNDELAQELFTGGRGGVMVFSASKGRQYSLESPDIGGGFGIFTYALIQSLGPRAKDVDTSRNGYVEFMELVDYVRAYVDRVTRGEQTPWLSRKELFGDLPVAVVN